jgi:hypothetical protein
MDTREFRGLELAAKAKIEQRRTSWYVSSASHDGGYKVSNEGTKTLEGREARVPPADRRIDHRADSSL